MNNLSPTLFEQHNLRRFRFLFWSLLMLIGLRPLLEEWINGRLWANLLTDIFFTFALMSGLHAVSGQPRQLRCAALISCLIIPLGVMHYFLKIAALDRLQMGLSAVFLMQMLVMIWVHIDQETEVTLDLIMAAACTYILIGMIWAYGYYFLESTHQGAFKVAENISADLWDFYYYSFVTLTTVGYGDIVAVSKSARALTIMEAIIGQLYLAIMISRLVGLHASQIGVGKAK